MNTLHPTDRTLASRLLNWFDDHGRKDLPWQTDTTPYRVWISEIMLQQTQVATVIPYYERFMGEFPTVEALSAAPEDDVLKLWSGLGYYARARNLHRGAKMVTGDLGGEFPDTVDGLCTLPGIGRSTAGAIISIAMGGRAPILDGNVKRVLARHHAVDGWPGKSGVAAELWGHAEAHTPNTRVADYTQAIMDLGATLCTRRRPQCLVCPLVDTCHAGRAGDPEQYPGKKPKRTTPTRSAFFALVVDHTGAVLLQKRPPSGIWGGLWSLPQSPDRGELENLAQRFGVVDPEVEQLPMIEHTFSHFRLAITPLRIRLSTAHTSVSEPTEYKWHQFTQSLPGGIPAPVAKLLAEQGHLPNTSQGDKA
ncbi:A/G-specific adenine glycosylase [Luminiphilus syltensis NOR5-1B]|uniref:Adenine DNA glycosylase n=1 Tax=Luminiphilus syltensis NOR5-1B TaxID=565045 RepID=B8KUN1_9GAMM|nr:A/G-specific adenine glycosylase [Luminiphilus syltensis]EED35748.1 A/G-specific adenine glycosylase [Luminiphilus syltensis NOR5-1B]